MRRLVLLRGIPGSGKTAWVKDYGLTKYSLSPDTLFEMTTSTTLSPTGEENVDQSRLFKFTMEIYERILEQRMQDGSFIVVDALNIKSSDFDRYIRLAKKYAYEIFCVDFSGVPLADCIKRKPDVLEKRIRQDYSKMMSQKFPQNIRVVQPTKTTEILLKKKDLSGYKRIHHIGDIHGCSTILLKCLSNMQEDELYIFCGDYINRGPDSVGVLRQLIDIMDRPNVILLEGNHEGYLRKWIAGENTGYYEFESTTVPQLERSISRKAVKRFTGGLKECFWYSTDNKEVFTCHGGVSSMLGNPIFVPSKDLISGCGSYTDTQICDDNFAKNSNGIIQIHGHRHPEGCSYQVNENCYCLEDSIGGKNALRELILDVESGEFTLKEYME